MMMKKLAIASAVALMSMGSVYAQQTTVTTTVAPESAAGLMTTLSNSVNNLFGTEYVPAVAAVSAVAPVAESYAVYDPSVTGDFGKPRYVTAPDGTYRLATEAELALATPPVFYAYTPAVAGVDAVTAAAGYTTGKLVDITALAGAVNLSAINGGINITGTNVSLSGLANIGATATTGLSTTVIGAMNSSTLDIAKMTVNLSDMTSSTLNIAGLANQGAAPSITTQSFGPGQLGLATIGSTILDAAVETTQFDMNGLVSGTDTLATSTTDKLQAMNVFNMAVNMAPLVAGVNIVAAVDPNAWFLNPQTGIVNLSGLSIATTAIGAMNSSLTSLGAKLR